MEFEWDESKSQRNLAERGFDFDTAATAFYDPQYVDGPARIRQGEQRYSLIGRCITEDVLFVVYTWRHYEHQSKKVCRIISARKAHKTERSRYQAVHEIREGKA